MIETSGLTKRYSVTTALDHVDLLIRPGEIVGLLGPNGAGKTTMLKILTGYLPPSEGQAKVAGLDVLSESLAVRRRIGYLPEANPLYDDMTVWESLLWTARLRGLSAEAEKPAMDRVIDSCGLAAALGKEIGELSKGYRQRVGLAQSIIHDPEILILDEPTSGLDPNQQQDVRDLIQTLKLKKTVLLSTHILSEARSACDRVLIIHRGKIVADGTPERLSAQSAKTQRLTLELKAPAEPARAVLAAIAGVLQVTLQRDNGMSALFAVESAAPDFREAVAETCVRERWPVLHMALESASLEDVFRELTMEGR